MRVRETTRLLEKVTIPITTQWSNNPTAINFVFSLLFVVFGNIEVHTKIFSTHSYAGDSTVTPKMFYTSSPPDHHPERNQDAKS